MKNRFYSQFQGEAQCCCLPQLPKWCQLWSAVLYVYHRATTISLSNMLCFFFREAENHNKVNLKKEPWKSLERDPVQWFMGCVVLSLLKDYVQFFWPLLPWHIAQIVCQSCDTAHAIYCNRSLSSSRLKRSFTLTSVTTHLCSHAKTKGISELTSVWRFLSLSCHHQGNAYDPWWHLMNENRH